VNFEEAKKLWEEAGANIDKLDACQGPHDFVQIDQGMPALGRRYRCKKCLGIVPAVNRHWYERGLAHGKAAR